MKLSCVYWLSLCFSFCIFYRHIYDFNVRQYLIPKHTYVFSVSFTDTPSTNKIRPLVNPASLHITSRGRVAFNIIPINRTIPGVNSTNDKLNLMDFLSPEYLKFLDRRGQFSESDIEKVSLSGGRQGQWRWDGNWNDAIHQSQPGPLQTLERRLSSAPVEIIS